MARSETQIPPPPPRASLRGRRDLGLWVVASPDAALVGRCLPVTDGVEIGREAGLDGFGGMRVRVDDSWLSRAHLRLHPPQGPEGPFWVEDLGSRNGCVVEGEPTRGAWVRLGALLRAGATLLVLERGRRDDDDRGLLGWSAPLAGLRDEIAVLGPSPRPVHIHGETGAGKERVAAALHAASARKGELLALNMAAIVPSLAESQLFGHRRGAFSGATHDVDGAFDVADGGTLLLDEIAELDAGLQAKLLRAVELGEVHRVGDPRPHRVDVRLLTATHRDLAAEVAAGRFRDDLRWRLCAAKLEVAPLRARRLDVLPLFEHFLALTGTPLPSRLAMLRADAAWHVANALERYLLHAWPGNVRELRAEALRFADLMRARGAAALTTPIPPVEELLADFAFAAPATPPAANALSTDDERDASTVRLDVAPLLPRTADGRRAAAEALLADPDALARALSARADGRVKRLAALLAPDLGRSAESARRAIYRALGDRLPALRDEE